MHVEIESHAASHQVAWSSVSQPKWGHAEDA